MSVDPHTSRIWFATTLPSLCGARISWSDDDGDHWKTNPSVGCPAQGGEKLLEGPAPAAGAKPVGYPHVVYYCANTIDIAASNLWCYKSLDGGATFNFVGSFPDPTPPAGCSERHPSRPGVVGPDGVLYFPTTLCGALGIAISPDEGTTWQFRPIVSSGFQGRPHGGHRRGPPRHALHRVDRPRHPSLSGDVDHCGLKPQRSDVSCAPGCRRCGAWRSRCASEGR